MIDRIRPQAHGRNRFGRAVAAASVTLAASLSGAGCNEGDDDGDIADTADVDVPPGDVRGDTADVPEPLDTADVDVPPGDVGGDMADVPEPLDADADEDDGADVPVPPMDAGGILPDAEEPD
jgi:hypothetical protein